MYLMFMGDDTASMTNDGADSLVGIFNTEKELIPFLNENAEEEYIWANSFNTETYEQIDFARGNDGWRVYLRETRKFKWDVK